jgi:UPF0271 protein
MTGNVDTMDLVADVGESFGAYRMGNDDEIFATITSANVACGFHAGDPRSMQASVRACLAHGVAIGAHPGFPDLVGFGRRTMDLTRDEISTDVLYQLGALDAFARAADTSLTHVSPHGRLGNLAVTDRRYALGVADAVESYDPTLVTLTQAGELEREARTRGLPVAVMGLIDRAYEDDGNLVSRREPGAVLHDPGEITDRALSMVLDGSVRSRNGKRVEITCDSLLLHGDNYASIEAARRVRAALESHHVTVAAPWAARGAGAVRA